MSHAWWDYDAGNYTGDATCDGLGGCVGSMFGVLGLVVPPVFIIGIVVLIIKAQEYRRKPK